MAKKDLEGFDTVDINAFARHYDIHVTDQNDLLWLLAIAIMSFAKEGKVQMPPYHRSTKLFIEDSESERRPYYKLPEKASRTPPPRISRIRKPPTPLCFPSAEEAARYFVPRETSHKLLFPESLPPAPKRIIPKTTVKRKALDLSPPTPQHIAPKPAVKGKAYNPLFLNLSPPTPQHIAPKVTVKTTVKTEAKAKPPGLGIGTKTFPPPVHPGILKPIPRRIRQNNPPLPRAPKGRRMIK